MSSDRAPAGTPGAPRDEEAQLLFGRADELRGLQDMLDVAAPRGDVRIIRGEVGVGKSAVLDAAVRLAAGRGFLVLRAYGIQTGNRVAYSALHEALHSLLDRTAGLPARQRPALRTIFGLEEGHPPEPLLISLGTLGLLEDAAHDQPLLLALEDVMWMDGPTQDVVGFLSRRLANVPLFVLATQRLEEAEPLAGLKLPSITIERIDDGAAGSLLRQYHPRLDEQARTRVVAEAAGNPLALLELPRALEQAGVDPGPAHLGRLPLTEHLGRLFGEQLEPLPPSCRQFLLLAAANDAAAVGEVLAAAAHSGLSVDDVVPAESAGIVRIDFGRIWFRHPLVRSAVYSSASLAQRSAAHSALASAVDDPGRVAWHRAAAAQGLDERVATALVAAADTYRERGNISAASTALERAARMSPDREERARRLNLAARAGMQGGARRAASRLVAEAVGLASDPLTVADPCFTEYLLHQMSDTPARSSTAFLDVARSVTGHRQESVLLIGAATNCLNRGAEPAVRAAVERAALQLETSPEDPTRAMVLAMVAPQRYSRAVSPGLDALSQQVRSMGTSLFMTGVGVACEAVQLVEASERCYLAAVESARAAGAVVDLCIALERYSVTLATRGRLGQALAASEEAVRLAVDVDVPVAASAAAVVSARVHAWRGDPAALRASLSTAHSHGGEALYNHVQANASWARGLAALTQRRYRDAAPWLAGLRDLSPSSVLAVADLAEAAHHIPEDSIAAAAARALAEDAECFDSGHLRALLARGQAVRTGGTEAQGLLEAALAEPLHLEFPLEAARTRLALGEGLRRQRRPVEAREHLAAAAHAFDAAGALPWTERARAALRATGVSLPQLLPDPAAALTPQERQIAGLAARGLSNREIADQVFLSHRTVATHLYRLFPKLGITRRGELASALRTPTG